MHFKFKNHVHIQSRNYIIEYDSGIFMSIRF